MADTIDSTASFGMSEVPDGDAGGSMPPCCGTGCAVCVLDYREAAEPGRRPEPEAVVPVEPVCCNSGCMVCVLDYSDAAVVDCGGTAEIAELLDAFESAGVPHSSE